MRDAHILRCEPRGDSSRSAADPAAIASGCGHLRASVAVLLIANGSLREAKIGHRCTPMHTDELMRRLIAKMSRLNETLRALTRNAWDRVCASKQSVEAIA